MKIKIKGQVFPGQSILQWDTQASRAISIITSGSASWLDLMQVYQTDARDRIRMVTHVFLTSRTTVWFSGRPLRTR